MSLDFLTRVSSLLSNSSRATGPSNSCVVGSASSVVSHKCYSLCNEWFSRVCPLERFGSGLIVVVDVCDDLLDEFLL